MGLVQIRNIENKHPDDEEERERNGMDHVQLSTRQLNIAERQGSPERKIKGDQITKEDQEYLRRRHFSHMETITK
jgi:hypothetical protein